MFSYRLVVNEYVNVKKEYYKRARSMVDSFIKKGEFYLYDNKEEKRLLSIFYLEY